MQFNKWGLYIVIWVTSFGFAQKAAERIPLVTFISQIEQQFNVKFSYAVEDVNGLTIASPKSSLSLPQAIDYLNANVLLNFKALDERYITVSLLHKRISIAGIIKAEDSKNTLHGATITTDNHSVLTNKNGYFNFENIPLSATVTISYIGYESQQFKANELFSTTNKPKEIVLKPSNEELNQVIINVYLTPGLQKYLDGSTVLNTKKFGILPGLIEPDVLQSIQTLPGVESTNESIATLMFEVAPTTKI